MTTPISSVLASRLITLQVFKETVWGTPGPATAMWMGIQPEPNLKPKIKSTLIDEQRGSLINSFVSVILEKGGDFSVKLHCSYEEMLFFLQGCVKGGVTPAAASVVAITSSTNASPIHVITTAPHGLVGGEQIAISGHLLNTNANGTWLVGYVGASELTLYHQDTTPSIGNAVGGATGNVQIDGVTQAITSTSGATPDAVTTTNPHGLNTGDQVIITGVATDVLANSTCTIVKTGANTFTLYNADGTPHAGSAVGGTGGACQSAPFHWQFDGPTTAAWPVQTFSFEFAYSLGVVFCSGAVIQKASFKQEVNKTWEVDLSGFVQTMGLGDLAITAATLATPIKITSPAHGLATGQSVTITGCDEAAANGTWTITRVDADDFSLNTSVGAVGAGTTGSIQRNLTPGVPYRQVEFVLTPGTQVGLDVAGTVAGLITAAPNVLIAGSFEIDTGIKPVMTVDQLYPTNFTYDKYVVKTSMTLLYSALVKGIIENNLISGVGKPIIAKLRQASGAKSLVVILGIAMEDDPQLFGNKDAAQTIDLKFGSIYDSTLTNQLRIVLVNQLALLP